MTTIQIYKSNKMLLIEGMINKELIKFLTEEYIYKKMTIRQICKEIYDASSITVNPGQLSTWLKKFNIKARKPIWR